MRDLNPGEIEGHDFRAGKSPAGHGVGSVLAHPHLVAPAAAVEGVAAAGDGYSPAAWLRMGCVASFAPCQSGYGPGSGNNIGRFPHL